MPPSPTTETITERATERAAEPVWLVDLEAGGPPPEPPASASDGQPYTRASVAVRVHGELVGVVDVDLDGGAADGEEVARRATEALRDRIDAHLERDGLAPGVYRNGGPPRCLHEHRRFLERAPLVSIVIASRDGEATLADTLDSLMDLDYPVFEVIVVDNASRGDGVRGVVAEYEGAPHPVRYVREDRPGLALAHNSGLEHAAGTVVAFIDDDVIADPRWLAQIAKGFEAAPDVACVTGLILPAELESPAQLWVEGFWGFGKGFERRVFDDNRPAEQPLYPFTAGVFGSGANMTFRTDVLRELGGFDPGLGTGSPALGGDDLAMFFSVVTSGRRLVYEPTAVVRHRHRRDYASLQRQAYGYGVGLTAYLVKTLIDEPRRALRLAAYAPRALSHILHPSSSKNATRPEGLPSELQWIERRGMLAGPLAYVRGRRRRRALYARRGAAS
jgi:GT2 family glycosyltransferase